jgi:TPR repeat protein
MKMNVRFKMKTIILIAVFLLPLLSSCGIISKNCENITAGGSASSGVSYKECKAEQGDQLYQYDLGLEAYKNGDYSLAIKWLEKAAEFRSGRNFIYVPSSGDVALGSMARQEGKVNHSYGLPSAQLLLADMYERGTGVDIDIEKAKSYRQKADKAYQVKK